MTIKATRIILLLIAIALVLALIATGVLGAQAKDKTWVDVCFPHPSWNVKSVPQSAVPGMIEAGAFVIDAEHPCPPEGDPVSAGAHLYYLPNAQRDCTFCLWEYDNTIVSP